MSQKINQKQTIPAIIKHDEVALPQTVEAVRQKRKDKSSGSKSSPATSKKVIAQNIPQKKVEHVSVLEMDSEDITALKSVMKDQTTFEISQLYSDVETLAKHDSSLEVKQGLRALEDHVRLREYLYLKQTTASGD
ncbi:MAG: hypothetical protein ACRBBN_04940 [Methyloligellaceae bacterium]